MDRIPLTGISNADATRLQMSTAIILYAKTAMSCISDDHIVNEVAMGGANCTGHTILFPTSTPYTTSTNAKQASAPIDHSQACSAHNIS